MVRITPAEGITQPDQTRKTKIKTKIMKSTIQKLFVAAAATAFLSVGAHADHHKKADLSDKTVVEIAASMDDFSTLVAAVKAAGLAETLSGDGPFTVFAPTNEAFAALPEGTVETLLKPENKEKLISILTYHVVPAKVLAADVTPGEVATVNGESFTVSVEDDTVMVDDAKVVKTDVVGKNGVIHVIDSVIMPE